MKGRIRILFVGMVYGVIFCAAGQSLADQEKGYVARPCGFDMNRNGIIGEPADALVGDGSTSDPDGDGVNEDIWYVDADTGSDTTGSGSPGNPYRTIQKAMNMCDGPGDGAEDIIAISGVFRESLTLRQSGLSEHYIRDNFQFPRNPMMIVGWDKDGDGEYPPYDTDETAVLDGSTVAGYAITNGVYVRSYIEIAHLSVRNYYTAGAGGRGVLRLGKHPGSSTPINHIYMHDVEMSNINTMEVSGVGSSSICISFWLSSARTTHIAVINNLVDGFGLWFARGTPQNESGFFRFQNNTLKMQGSGNPSAPLTTAAFKMWDRHSDVEILDNIIDSQAETWGGTYENGPTGIGIRPCARRYTVRGNVLINLRGSIGLDGYASTACGNRTCHDHIIDRNMILVTWTGDWDERGPGQTIYQSPHGIHLKAGETVTSTIEDVTITNNFILMLDEKARAVYMDVGNNQGTQPGTVIFTGNTICGPGPAAVEFYAFQVIPTVTYRQQNFVFKNNIIANVGSSEVNMRLTYAPTNWIANGNIYDPQGRYYWNNASLGTSFASWRSASGQDAESKTGTPTFVDIPSGDLHLDPNDTVARGFGVDITDITDWDIDGDPRDPFSPTAGADVGTGTADTDPPTIVAWASAGDHGRGVGEALLDISDDGSFSEPRSGGIAKLIVDFSERMDPLSFTPGAVQIAGLGAAGQPIDLGGIVIGTELRDSDTVGVITFTPALPDYARYAVGIAGATDHAGNELVGDVDRIATALCGDVSGDLRVNATDFSRVRAARTRLIDPGVADQVRADVSMDGRINASDLSRIRARRSNDARGIADPGL